MFFEDDPSLEDNEDLMVDVDQVEASVKGREEDAIRLWLLKRDLQGLLSLVGFCTNEWQRRRLELEEEEHLKVVSRFWLEVVIVTGEGREKTGFYSQEERGEQLSIGHYSKLVFVG